MFVNGVGVAIIKLGASTIIDCLKNGIYIITINNLITNKEFYNNYKSLKKFNLVKKYKNLSEANLHIMKLTSFDLKNYYNNCKDLNWGNMKYFINEINKN